MSWLIPRRWAHRLPEEKVLFALAARNPEMFHASRVGQWEAAVADYVGVPYAVAVSSGRRCLALALEYLHLRPGDEVIVPAYTLGALIPIIEQYGARAVAADIDPTYLNMTPEDVARRITSRTRCILALHAFGAPADIVALRSLAERNGITLIEDCAHALGAGLGFPNSVNTATPAPDGAAFSAATSNPTPLQKVGSFGWAGFFSFEPTKPVNTYGGGMLVTQDAALAEYVREKIEGLPVDLSTVFAKARSVRLEQRLMRSGLAQPLLFLSAAPFFTATLEAIYRRKQPVPPAECAYSPLQAELGLRQLPSLDARIERRERYAAQVQEMLPRSVTLQQLPPNTRSTRYFLVALLPIPAAPVRRQLLRYGIDAAVGSEIADDVGTALGQDCPGSRRAFTQALGLPIYDDMNEKTLQRIARALRKIIG